MSVEYIAEENMYFVKISSMKTNIMNVNYHYQMLVCLLSTGSLASVIILFKHQLNIVIYFNVDTSPDNCICCCDNAYSLKFKVK